jgi:hypothetical protein
MKKVVYSLLMFSLALSAGGQCRIYAPRVKQIPVIVGSNTSSVSGTRSVDINYCLSFGDEETDRIDEESGRARSQQNLMLLHPVPEAASRMSSPTPHRWLTKCLNGFVAPEMAIPLLVESTWKKIPAPVRHVLVALGIDDPDLILVSCQQLSGSISIYYSPRYQRDRAFYEAKLEILNEYLKNHDPRTDVPLSSVVHTDDAAA